MFHRLLQAGALVAVLLGCHQIAFAQGDGCKLDVREVEQRQYLVGGCPMLRCNTANRDVCNPGWFTVEGEKYQFCVCGASYQTEADCILGFHAFPNAEDEGQAKCFRAHCPHDTHTCRVITTGDDGAALRQVTCICR
jgi:hypothetical protein